MGSHKHCASHNGHWHNSGRSKEDRFGYEALRRLHPISRNKTAGSGACGCCAGFYDLAQPAAFTISVKRGLAFLSEPLRAQKARKANAVTNASKGLKWSPLHLIPFLAALHVADSHAYVKTTLAIATALLGVLITVLEGILQLNQYQQLWVTSRSACEALNHEKYLYFAKAGDYAKSDEPVVLLAERVEAIAFEENAKWASLLQQHKEAKSGT